MLEHIIEKIETLPPLPQTIVDIENFRKEENQDIDDLVQIIERDALCVASLLKIANSSFFGFKTKIETVKKVINLLGINFTVYVVIKESINSILQTDLKPYGVDCDDFTKASNSSTSIVNFWLDNTNKKFKDEVLLASLLQDTGKFVISETIKNRGLSKEFNEKIKSCSELCDVERELLHTTTNKVSAEIFRCWEFNKNLVDIIELVDDMEKCDEENRKKCQVLDILRILCDVRNPLGEEAVQKALTKALKYGLDTKGLNDSIKRVKNQLLLEMN